MLATGAAAKPALKGRGVFTGDDTCGVESLGGLLRDLEEGCSSRLAMVVPPGPRWPLPADELALLIAGDARGMGTKPEIVLVTPEQADAAAADIAAAAGAVVERKPFRPVLRGRLLTATGQRYLRYEAAGGQARARPPRTRCGGRRARSPGAG